MRAAAVDRRAALLGMGAAGVLAGAPGPSWAAARQDATENRARAAGKTASNQSAYVEELLAKSKSISGVDASPNANISGETERKTNRMVAPPQNLSREEKAKLEAKEAKGAPSTGPKPTAAAKPAASKPVSKAEASSAGDGDSTPLLVGGVVLAGAAAVALGGGSKDGATPAVAASSAGGGSAAAAAAANKEEAKKWIENWKKNGAKRKF